MSVDDTAMTDAMHSPARSIPASPSMLRAAPFPTEEVMRALMTTVGDRATTVASHQTQTEHQIALLTQLVQSQLGNASLAGPRRPVFRGEPPPPALTAPWRFVVGCAH